MVVQFYGEEYDFPVEEDVRQGRLTIIYAIQDCVQHMYTSVFSHLLNMFLF